MRVLVQRVSRAEVRVEDKVLGQVGHGLCLLIGLTHDDDKEKVQKMAEKIVNLRLFKDDKEKMNLSLKEVGGEILVVSQFTLYGDTRKGRRPSFLHAAKPEQASPLIDWFVDCLKALGITVETGLFGANMQVDLINDGPLTLMLEH